MSLFQKYNLSNISQKVRKGRYKAIQSEKTTLDNPGLIHLKWNETWYLV